MLRGRRRTRPIRGDQGGRNAKEAGKGAHVAIEGLPLAGPVGAHPAAEGQVTVVHQGGPDPQEEGCVMGRIRAAVGGAVDVVVEPVDLPGGALGLVAVSEDQAQRGIGGGAEAMDRPLLEPAVDRRTAAPTLGWATSMISALGYRRFTMGSPTTRRMVLCGPKARRADRSSEPRTGAESGAASARRWAICGSADARSLASSAPAGPRSTATCSPGRPRRWRRGPCPAGPTASPA